MSRREDTWDDWDTTDERTERRWISHGDNSPVTHYEFFLALEPIDARMRMMKEKIDDMEERLVETRAKHLVVDLFVTGTGRFLLIALSLGAAFVVSKLGYGPFG